MKGQRRYFRPRTRNLVMHCVHTRLLTSLGALVLVLLLSPGGGSTQPLVVGPNVNISCLANTPRLAHIPLNLVVGRCRGTPIAA